MKMKRIMFFLVIGLLISDVIWTLCSSSDVEEDVYDDWFEQMNEELEEIHYQSASLAWQASTDMVSKVNRQSTQFEAFHSAWNRERCHQASSFIWSSLTDSHQRMLKRLCRGPRYEEETTKELIEEMNRLRQIYTNSYVTINGNHYHGEPDLSGIMIQSRNESLLKWIWIQWRQAVGPPSRSIYRHVVDLLNSGAKNAGYNDIGEVWRSELEIDHLESVVDQLYNEIEPFYQQLHSFVRGRLHDIYGSDVLQPDQGIPAHILGNMWAQNWQPLSPYLTEYIKAESSVTNILKSRNLTVENLIEMAENFFLSLGFPPLPKSFWEKSQFVQPQDGRQTVCHASSANFFRHNDVRLLMCAQVNEEDFYTIHHELGHLYYFLFYNQQPQLFRSGANSAFHEAIGDTIIYAAMATQHSQRLGFLRQDSKIGTKEKLIGHLLKQALAKIPLLPFSLVMEKWRWNVFSGNILSSNYNSAWWKLANRYQGIVPPIKRSENDFDPIAKFHIAENTPYIRYFLSGILQMQFFEALCEASHQGPKYGKPLHECDIYGSHSAGNRFRAMMSLGASQPWNVALNVLTRNQNSKLSAKPLLEYYKPLYEWLIEENQRRKYPIGWPLNG